ncbi:MAG: MBL fold metallo-hydrolase [Nitrospirae bacterium]|nr:MBL fold metallo-hydrolase [Nitrospirota bacterium]
MRSDARIHRLTIPVPFPVKTVNLYLIEGPEGLCLIDTSTRNRSSWLAFKKGIRDLGRNISDIRLMLLTHSHPDHAGQARRIKKISGAKVVSHEKEIRAIERGNWEFGAYPRITAYLRRRGVPMGLIMVNFSIDMSKGYVRESVDVDETVSDDQVLHFAGEEIRVIHVPGHTNGQMVLYMPQRRVLFSADHLLPTITPVPLLQFPEKETKPKALSDFMKSVDKIMDLEVDMTYPSHGEPFVDHRELIRRYHVLKDKRAKKVERLLSSGPRTPYQLSVEVFGGRAKTQMMLAMSEVMGHLEILEEQNRVKVTEKKGLLFYEMRT